MPNRLNLYLGVGIGGVIGALGRYAISILFESDSYFPFGTLVANLLGCLLLGFLLNSPLIKNNVSNIVFIGLTTGLIGAFTTFSTFALETVHLAYHHLFLAFVYVGISVLGGIFLSFLGFRLANKRQA
ncbi:fluoride efflux transporter FluC [Ornithinibacillus californiensis]|uniref:fluoride efflux transporter FluC n=1 Tax=Ornithinibacillus californiensis TaxID=161536 RepID=UPI00064D8C53|nr:CrcB family protein [Ornithinibacillus californiensis]